MRRFSTTPVRRIVNARIREKSTYSKVSEPSLTEALKRVEEVCQSSASTPTATDSSPWTDSTRGHVPQYDGWDESIEEDFKRRITNTKKLQSRTSGIYDSVLDFIGNTPMVRLSRLSKVLDIDESIEICAKLEYFNAGGSVKDRVGMRMIEEAEKDGRIKPGDILIEPTSGNTGIGLCLAGAVKGYKVVICLPQKMSGEKVNTMRALGAEILRTPTEAKWNGADSHISLAADLASVSKNAHVLDQYLNAGNPLAHYEGTAEEILQQTDGRVDVIIMTAGTGGTITGTARKLKEHAAAIGSSTHVVAVDPVGSTLAKPDSLNDHKRLEGYHVEGIGYDFLPTVLDHSVIDEWVKVDDQEAFDMARMMIRHEGLMVGGSSGSCMAGAHQWIKANEESLKGKRVVILCADSIRNYMSKFLDDKWLEENHLANKTKAGAGEGRNPSPSQLLKARLAANREREKSKRES